MAPEELEAAADEMEKLADRWAGESLEAEVRGAALEALAEAAKTSSFMLDMWAEAQRPAQVKEAVREAAGRLRTAALRARRPDDRKEILSGASNWGHVFLPTDLFRTLWTAGKEVDGLLQRKGNGAEVERTSLRLLELAAEWVRFCEGRDEGDVQKELYEVTPIEGQRMLRRLQSEPRAPEGGDPPF